MSRRTCFQCWWLFSITTHHQCQKRADANERMCLFLTLMVVLHYHHQPPPTTNIVYACFRCWWLFCTTTTAYTLVFRGLAYILIYLIYVFKLLYFNYLYYINWPRADPGPTLLALGQAELPHHGLLWLQTRQKGWGEGIGGRTSMHTLFSFFLYLLSQMARRDTLLPLNYRLHALVTMRWGRSPFGHVFRTTRGVLPPLSAHFLAFDPMRGGGPPLSAFLTPLTHFLLTLNRSQHNDKVTRSLHHTTIKNK